jgi:aryl-alcohol dehydrogenase-like predicted oxidoreductase
VIIPLFLFPRRPLPDSRWQTYRSKSVPIVSVQNRYSFTDRGSEDVLNYCEEHNSAFIPWFPLAAGPESALRRLAEQWKATPSQIALAWLLRRSPAILPIPGTSSVEHLEENVAAAALKIDEGKMKALDEQGERVGSRPLQGAAQ